MHYKMIAIALVVSGSLVAVENKSTVALPTSKTSQADRINELENRKIEIGVDAEKLSRRAIKEAARLSDRMATVQPLLRPSCGKNDKVAFGQFILTLCDMFKKGEDINQLVTESVVRIPRLYPSAQILFLAVVRKTLYVERIADEHKKLGQELLAINQELHTLDLGEL